MPLRTLAQFGEAVGSSVRQSSAAELDEAVTQAGDGLACEARELRNGRQRRRAEVEEELR